MSLKKMIGAFCQRRMKLSKHVVILRNQQTDRKKFIQLIHKHERMFNSVARQIFLMKQREKVDIKANRIFTSICLK